MSQKKLRQHIASEAARLMCEPGQPGYDQAKREALRQFKTDRLRPQDFPTNLEIREEIVALAEVRQA
ncbi:MAG TPA: tRNA adenylyltransferase, partial [Pirellulales bacterium]|nr:tRNA adenylyltransferase [Pirellulales bacterium]